MWLWLQLSSQNLTFDFAFDFVIDCFKGRIVLQPPKNNFKFYKEALLLKLIEKTTTTTKCAYPNP